MQLPDMTDFLKLNRPVISYCKQHHLIQSKIQENYPKEYNKTVHQTVDFNEYAQCLQHTKTAGPSECARTFNAFTKHCYPALNPGQTLKIPCEHFFMSSSPDKLLISDNSNVTANYVNAYCDLSQEITYKLSPEDFSGCYAMNDSLFKSLSDFQELVSSSIVNQLLHADSLVIMKQIFLIFQCVSIIFCSLGIFTMVYYKCVYCKRMAIHFQLILVHFFYHVTTACNLYFSLKSHRHMIPDMENDTHFCFSYLPGFTCLLVRILFNYFKIAGYAWMCCEGIYLYSLINSNFTFHHDITMNHYLVLGWLTPILPMIFYIFGMIISTNAETEVQHNNYITGVTSYFYYKSFITSSHCWLHSNLITKAIAYFCQFLIYLNLAVTIMVIKTIVVKLQYSRRQSQITDIKRKSKSEITYRSIKSILILIPLLGINQLIPLGFYGDKKMDSLLNILAGIVAVLRALQGTVIVIFFVLCDKTLLRKFKGWWEHRRDVRDIDVNRRERVDF